MENVGQKLDDITMKLEAMTEAIVALGNAIEAKVQELGETMGKLTGIIEQYTNTMNERSVKGFDRSRQQLMQVSQEIGTLRSVTGIDQIMRLNAAIGTILSLLEKSIDPNSIQKQINEITHYITTVGGQK